MKTLVLGGVKSGKSRHAEQLAVASGLPVTLIATALAGDDEMSQRIERHKLNRPEGWHLIEEPLDIAGRLRQIADGLAAAHSDGAVCVIVDCLTLWLAQSLDQLGESQSLASLRDELLNEVSRFPGELVLVANETNMGVTPMGKLSRQYCDEAGLLHQALARECDSVVLTVAGLPLSLKSI